MPKMTDDEFEAFLSAEISDAESYIMRNVAVRRERNYDYFMAAADPDRMMFYLPPAKGQSKAISTDVSDYIGMVMPNLMRTVAGSRKLFDYQAKGQGDEGAAKVCTDFVNDIVMRFDNPGEAVLRQQGLDGLVQIVGVVKVCWEEKEDSEDYEYSGVGAPALVNAAMALKDDPTIEAKGITEDENGTYRVKFARVFNRSHCCVDAVPPEEFVISQCRKMEDATVRLQRTYKRAGDLIDMGIDEEIIKELPSFDQSTASLAAYNRALSSDHGFKTWQEDDYLREVAIYEGVVLCNKDGKGLKEWYILAGGSDGGVKVLKCEPFRDQVYFCDFCPEPLPHLFFGKCPADELVENQNIQTMLKRGLLTNIYFGNNPMREVVTPLLQEGAIDQLLTPVPMGLVFTKAAGAVNPIPVTDQGAVTLEAIQYIHSEAERRVGVTQRSQGLKPNQVNGQSATEALIDHNASLGQVEDYARVWATGGLRKLGRAILRVLKRYQDFDRMVMMNGQTTPVNPQAWAEFDDWDCIVSTGLGTGRRERDSQIVQAIITKQEEIIQTLGLDNPICSPDQYTTALRDAIELEGLDPDRYFKALQPGQPVQMPQPPPDPKMIEAQQRLQMDGAVKKAELQMKREEGQIKVQTTAAIAAMKADHDAALAKKKMDQQFSIDIEKMNRESVLRKEEMEMEADLKLLSIVTKTGSQNTNIPRPQ